MIYLIRHMQSEANVKQIAGGDYPLTEKGILDAKELAKQIDFKPDVLIVSPLIRAQQTASLLFSEKEFIVDSAFREIHFGDFEDTLMEDNEFLQTYKTRASMLHEVSHGDNIKERADKAIVRLLDYLPRGNVAVVCHDMIIRSIICRLKGEDLDNMPKYEPLTTNGCIVKFDLSSLLVFDEALRSIEQYETH